MQDFDCKSSTDLEPQRKRLTCFLVRHRNATVLQTAGPSAKIHPLKCLHSKHPLQSSHFNLYAISGLDPPTRSYPPAQKRPGAMHLDIKRAQKTAFFLRFAFQVHGTCEGESDDCRVSLRRNDRPEVSSTPVSGGSLPGTSAFVDAHVKGVVLGGLTPHRSPCWEKRNAGAWHVRYALTVLEPLAATDATRTLHASGGPCLCPDSPWSPAMLCCRRHSLVVVNRSAALWSTRTSSQAGDEAAI